MRIHNRLAVDDRGAAAVEMAFAIPILVVMLWAFVQLAQVYRAVAGIQQALGEGARYATLCLSQSATGCAAPTATQIKAKINASVYGIGPGTCVVADPVPGTSGTAGYYDLTVSYSQPTNLLLFRGPTMALSRSKRVWIATNGTPS
jgi:Flp pilus assembly protein TadG